MPRYGVLNQGSAGNRVAIEAPVRTVVAEGISDLLAGTTAEWLTAGLRATAERARLRGLRVRMRMRDDADALRRPRAVHTGRGGRAHRGQRLDRESGVLDGVPDADRALRDPAARGRLPPAYDSGDQLHAGDAGYAVLAEPVDRRLL
ncbi:hypothetical protein [Streptomyces sp. NPDC058335]|uniref:hypothetical protein n=1 Tax=Streptomyces sp. NPDC058335 TaxID=3346451 RepID=UPI00365BB250